ncbi:MAG: hypothetical protein L3J36_11205 [Rhodobacteraceae bacterium]|nr:hypothetical protein [Paracoccaceae bacterium]
MTNGLKHDATVRSKTIGLGDDNDTATPSPDCHMTPERLVHDLLEGTGALDASAESEQPCEEANAQQAKPRRSLADRLIATPFRQFSAGLTSTKMAILSYQPVPRHIALLLMVTILLIVPWLVPSLLAGVLGIVAFTYLVLGHDFSCKMVATWFKWLKRRDSHGAEVVRARAERVSNRLTRWLDHLPANWTTGLYLPDFAIAEDFSEKLKSDPFGRLTGKAQNY